MSALARLFLNHPLIVSGAPILLAVLVWLFRRRLEGLTP